MRLINVVVFRKSFKKAESFVATRVWHSLTRCHGTHKYGVEFDDWAEDLFVICGSRQVFAVTFKDQTFVLFL